MIQCWNTFDNNCGVHQKQVKMIAYDSLYCKKSKGLISGESFLHKILFSARRFVIIGFVYFYGNEEVKFKDNHEEP